MLSRDEKFSRRETLALDAAAAALPLPDAVRRCREALGLTQEEFADRFRLTRSQVMQLESGRGNPTRNTLMKVAQPFGFVLGFVPRKK